MARTADGERTKLAREEYDSAWEKEIDRRVDDFRSGRDKGIPAAEVFRELRAGRSHVPRGEETA